VEASVTLLEREKIEGDEFREMLGRSVKTSLARERASV